MLNSIICLFLLFCLTKSVEVDESGSRKPLESNIRMVQEDQDSRSNSKHRMSPIINFAAESAGAIVLASSDECKGFSNLLNDDKDKYAMCPCSAKKKWVTIGLSEDVSVTIYLVFVC